MTNLDKSLNNYITHIKFLNLDAVNYYFITKKKNTNLRRDIMKVLLVNVISNK